MARRIYEQVLAWTPLVLVWTVLSPLYLVVGLWMLVTRKRIWLGR